MAEPKTAVPRPKRLSLKVATLQSKTAPCHDDDYFTGYCTDYAASGDPNCSSGGGGIFPHTKVAAVAYF